MDMLEKRLSKRDVTARRKEMELQAKSKATGKTVAQLIVESWDMSLDSLDERWSLTND